MDILCISLTKWGHLWHTPGGDVIPTTRGRYDAGSHKGCKSNLHPLNARKREGVVKYAPQHKKYYDHTRKLESYSYRETT